MVICSSTLIEYDALLNDAISHKCMHKFTTAWHAHLHRRPHPDLTSLG